MKKTNTHQLEMISTVKDSDSQAQAGAGTAISKSMENIFSIDVRLSERIAKSAKSGIYLLCNESRNNNRFALKYWSGPFLFIYVPINTSPYRSKIYAPCIVVINYEYLSRPNMFEWRKERYIQTLEPWYIQSGIPKRSCVHSVKLAAKRIVCIETSMKAKMLRINGGKQLLYKQTKLV